MRRERKLLVTMRVKNTELMEDVLDIIKEHIECELGCVYGGCVLADSDKNFKTLKIIIGNAFDEHGRLLVRKHILDGGLCDAIRFNVSEAAPVIIGTYLDDNGEVLTSDFFVDESNFSETIKLLGQEDGISKEKLDRLCDDDALTEKLIGDWVSYISEEESNLHGKEYLKEQIGKYVI